MDIIRIRDSFCRSAFCRSENIRTNKKQTRAVARFSPAFFLTISVTAYPDSSRDNLHPLCSTSVHLLFSSVLFLYCQCGNCLRPMSEPPLQKASTHFRACLLCLCPAKSSFPSDPFPSTAVPFSPSSFPSFPTSLPYHSPIPPGIKVDNSAYYTLKMLHEAMQVPGPLFSSVSVPLQR